MGRTRIYANSADRQRAYRTRQAAVPSSTSTGRRSRPPSRPKRLIAIQDAVQALLEEYEGWRERMPEFVRDTEQGARLDETIDQLTTVADVLADIQPPQGFGRD